MIYLIILALIVGFIIGKWYEKLRFSNIDISDIGLTEQDLLPERTETLTQDENLKIENFDWSNVAMLYRDKGGRATN